MSDIHLGLRIGVTPEAATPAEQHKVALAVCTYTQNNDVARELLDMLGLLEVTNTLRNKGYRTVAAGKIDSKNPGDSANCPGVMAHSVEE